MENNSKIKNKDLFDEVIKARELLFKSSNRLIDLLNLGEDNIDKTKTIDDFSEMINSITTITTILGINELLETQVEEKVQATTMRLNNIM